MDSILDNAIIYYWISIQLSAKQWGRKGASEKGIKNMIYEHNTPVWYKSKSQKEINPTYFN